MVMEQGAGPEQQPIQIKNPELAHRRQKSTFIKIDKPAKPTTVRHWQFSHRLIKVQQVGHLQLTLVGPESKGQLQNYGLGNSLFTLTVARISCTAVMSAGLTI